MRRIYSYNLAILFYFLQGKTWSIPITNRVRKEALDSLFDNLESIVATQDIFCRKIQNDSYIVSVEEPQKHKLKDYLQKYCDELENDHLYTEELQTFEWKPIRQEYVKKLVESHYNLNCYHITNVYDLYLVAPELMKFDYNIKIEIDSRFVPQHNSSSCHELFCRKNFKFNCTLNLSSILEEQEKTKTVKAASQRQNKTSNKFHFTKSQLYLLGLIQERIETGNDSVITLDDLERIYSPKKDDSELKTSLDMRMSNNVSKLNTEFKKITGKYILEKTDSYNIQIGKLNLSSNGSDYEIIATLEDIAIALELSSNTLE